MVLLLAAAHVHELGGLCVSWHEVKRPGAHSRRLPGAGIKRRRTRGPDIAAANACATVADGAAASRACAVSFRGAARCALCWRIPSANRVPKRGKALGTRLQRW